MKKPTRVRTHEEENLRMLAASSVEMMWAVRDNDRILFFCTTQTTAEREAREWGGWPVRVPCFCSMNIGFDGVPYDHNTYGPMELRYASPEDLAEEAIRKGLPLAEIAVRKARAAGMTDAEIAALRAT